MTEIKYCPSCNRYTHRLPAPKDNRCKVCGMLDRTGFVPMFSRDSLFQAVPELLKKKRKRKRKNNASKKEE